MKKAIVLLLALGMIAGFAFAQDAAAPAVTTAVSVWGEAGIYNNGVIDATLGGNNGIDLDFDASAGMFGFSTEFEFVQDGTTAPADQYFNYAYGWFQPIDMVKVNFGYLWNSGLRLQNSMSNYVAGGLINENATSVELYPVEGLTFAVVLPVPFDKSFATGAPAYALLVSDAVKELDFLAKYTMADVGTFYASYQMSDLDSKVNGGVNLTMVPDVGIMVGATYANIGATAQNITANLVGTYTMGDLKVGEEVNIYSISDASKSLGWLSNTYVNYYVVPKTIRLNLTVKVNNARLLTADTIAYSVTTAARFYDGSNFVNVGFNYAGSTATGAVATWKLPVSYSIAF